MLSNNTNEVINFGTHILKWDVTKVRGGKDKNVPSVFLRNSLEISDSISILIKNSSIEPSKILIRALMESTFGLIYLIEKNEDIRAHSFLVCKLNKEIRYYKQFIESEKTSKPFITKIKKQEADFKLSNHCNPQEIIKVIEAKKNLLNENIYKEVNIEYERTCTKKTKRKNDPAWYSLFDGPDNFEKLCEYLNSTILYEFLYRKYSENVHTTNVMIGFVASGKDTADIIQIRNFKDCKEVFYDVVNLLLDTYKVFIKNRLPERQTDFDNWYLSFEKKFEKVDFETQFRYLE